MKRNELITSINDLFDEINNLKARNEYLENTYMFYETRDAGDTLEIKTDLDRKLITYAKKKLYDQIIRSWNYSVEARRDNDTNETTIETFKDWLNRMIMVDDVPEYMSVEEAKNVIFDAANERYEIEKEKTLRELEQQKEADKQ